MSSLVITNDTATTKTTKSNINSNNNTKTSNNKLKVCSICKKKQSIYQCPKCFIKTCSLQCCITHKKQTKCNGKRDRTSYCPLNKFTNDRLSSDYHFLEDVMILNDRGKRIAKDMNGGKGNANDHNNAIYKKRMKIEEEEQENNVEHVLLSSRQQQEEAQKQNSNIPNYLQKLCNEAKLRNIQLLFMPTGMERRISNTTRFHPKSNLIHWKVEWKFLIPNNAATNENVNAAITYKTYYTDNVSEKTNIKVELDKIVKRTNKIIITNNDNDNNDNKQIKWILYLKSNPTCKFYNHFILDENNTNDNDDVTATLGTMLKGVTIIEYPTFYVVNDQYDKVDCNALFPLRVHDMEE